VVAEQSTLNLEHVSKSFNAHDGKGEVHAVDDVTLTILQGEFLTLLGPSGCGKTTTLRLIAGFETCTTGRIILDGKDITLQPANKRDMAMVFQSYALFPHMSVFDNIAYGLKVRNLSRSVIREKVQQALDLIGLPALGDRRPDQLSGGQQQRVSLARAMVMEPRVLLFDEPLSNLDAKLRVQMRTEIRGLQRRLQTTSVYVTHDQAEAMSLSDRIVVMNSGKIEQIGTPDEIYRRPSSRFVADFIGRANFVDAPVESVDGDTVVVTLLGQTIPVQVKTKHAVGDTMTAVLRPEGLQLCNDPNCLQVQVEQAMYLGSQVDYIVRFNNEILEITQSDPNAGEIFSEGQTVGVDFSKDNLHLLVN
jgi:iron(III) transport system ATP-binding protein